MPVRVCHIERSVTMHDRSACEWMCRQAAGWVERALIPQTTVMASHRIAFGYASLLRGGGESHRYHLIVCWRLIRGQRPCAG